jgi:predicted dehydrogenase
MGQREWDPKVYIRWRRYRDFSTGILGDLLVHVITPMLVAIEQGWPTRVVAVGSHMVDKAMENHDMVNLAIQFETGHQMIVAGSTCNEVGLETMIKGNKGNIYLNSRHCVVRPERGYSEEFDATLIRARRSSRSSISRRVRSGKGPPSSSTPRP